MQAGDKEATRSQYYVTLCVKTESGTKAIPWFYNAKFETLTSATRYRDAYLPVVDKINHSRPVPGLPHIEGERIIAITLNPAPNIDFYWDCTQSKLPSNSTDTGGVQKWKKDITPPKGKIHRTPENVQLYHGPKVKKSTARWLDRQQESASMVLFAIIAIMLLIELCSNQP